MHLHDYKVSDIIEYLKELNIHLRDNVPMKEIMETLSTCVIIRQKEEIFLKENVDVGKLTHLEYNTHCAFTEGIKYSMLLIEKFVYYTEIK